MTVWRRRVLPILVLGAWTAPAVAALSVGLHLSRGHDLGPRAERGGELAELLRAATHGHHHHLDATDHQHRGRVEPSAGSQPGAFSGGLLVASFVAAPSSSGSTCGESPPRRGPPVPNLVSQSCLLL